MVSRKYLEFARKFIVNNYNEHIKDITLDKDRPVLKIVFYREINLYIRYNDYGEYSYTIVFSPNPDDQMRFDNYDDVWNVRSRPHHFHSRGLKEVKTSPMKGNPEHDLPLLMNKILSENI